jgi:hypothetical protein
MTALCRELLCYSITEWLRDCIVQIHCVTELTIIVLLHCAESYCVTV